MLSGKEIDLRSILSLVAGTPDEAIVDLEPFYRLAIDNSTDQQIARGGIFHPSSVGYCMRSNILAYRRTPPSNRRTKDFQEIVDHGHLLHGLVANRFKAIAPALAPLGITFRFADEVRYNPATDELFRDLELGGTTDGIIEIETRTWSQRIILETKSINKDGIEDAKKTGPQYKHLMQAHLYAYRYDAPAIVIWYYAKNNSESFPFRRIFDPAIFDEAVYYFAVLNKYKENKKLPPREESYMECKECSYRTLCDPAILRRQTGGGYQVVPPKSLIRKKK